VADYNHHMSYVDKRDKTANSYSISCRTWQRTEKLFFHLLDLAILNSSLYFLHVLGRKFHTEIF
jgi:hypothetical protein